MKNGRIGRIFPLILVLAVLSGMLPGTVLAVEESYCEIGTCRYYSTISQDYVADSFHYTDQWFFESAGSRNDKLAVVSGQLASAATDAEHGMEFLQTLGFTDVQAYRYNSSRSDDCAYVTGTKSITKDGKTATLIAVAFQSAQYGDKGWQQNVRVNGGTGGLPETPDHVAYSEAADHFLSDLASLKLSGDVVIWMTGQSRAGGIVNVSASRLCRDGDVAGLKSTPAVFAYTFEAPATTENADAHDVIYNGIQNYICDDDLVTMIPLWGMIRYGQDIVYNTTDMEAVKRQLQKQNPDAFTYSLGYNADLFGGDVKAYVQGLIGKLEQLIPRREDYSTLHTDMYTAADVQSVKIHYTYQAALQALCHLVFTGDGMENVASSLMDVLPDVSYSYLEEVYADEKNPENSATLRSDAVFRRWNAAKSVYDTLEDQSFQPEAMYALMKILGVLFVDTSAVTGKDSMPSESSPEVIDAFNIQSVLNLTVAGSRTLIFSHHPDVILARIKLLAFPSGMEEAGRPEQYLNYLECRKGEDCPVNGFSDLEGDNWYHDGIHWALENGVMNGYGEGKFGPADATSRSMVVTTLWRMENSPESAYPMTFSDVPEGQWYTEAVCWAAENGIVNGYSEKVFAPDDLITREQLATVLYRYAGYKNMLPEEGETDNLSRYTDGQSISGWAVTAVRWAVGTGILQGTGKDLLEPGAGATRAQIATMLLRYQNIPKFQKLSRT